MVLSIAIKLPKLKKPVGIKYWYNMVTYRTRSPVKEMSLSYELNDLWASKKTDIILSDSEAMMFYFAELGMAFPDTYRYTSLQ